MTIETVTIKKQIGTISVHGRDAGEFLQGQLSNDLGLLDRQATILTAWCTPKGRVITLFDVSRIDSGYALTVPAELAEAVVARLTMFRFRAKVDFEVAADASLLSLKETIAAGIPFIGKPQSEKYTPHMLNLDLLNAVNFDKGCYTGQEIVARTHYKGLTKRRTLRFSCEQPVSVGDKISDQHRDLGDVLNTAGKSFLAVMPTAKADTMLSINGASVKRQPLPYFPNVF